MGAVIHIFVPRGGSWRWAATMPASVTPELAERAMLAVGAIGHGQPIHVVRVEDSWQPAPPLPESR